MAIGEHFCNAKVAWLGKFLSGKTLFSEFFDYRVYYSRSLHACTVIGNNSEVEISTRDYPPGGYKAIFNFTDIYGQSDQVIGGLFLTCTLSSLLEI